MENGESDNLVQIRKEKTKISGVSQPLQQQGMQVLLINSIRLETPDAVRVTDLFFPFLQILSARVLYTHTQ
ncbi:hypothetical protein DAPPUDRAFT_235778 [Daphnia pulex]|uniref:Uncharacterized protein n=1 Tax=Daphnia pulex TaxID=6669 RepID=E9G0T8_DAPPU|nr:hypothetical protein DAPPUDRAFT_235778 [Daphnia pulex]|eukprot:EFX87344.1 hypothetical protein DAPPUDRAFT_235778 [Daphnia pulex]